VPNTDLQLFVYEGDLNMKCSLKNPHKITSGGQICHAMITETEGKAVVAIILAFCMGCNSF